MSFIESMQDIKTGDSVVVSQGRHREAVCKVTRVTDKTFVVGKWGRFWKKNGKGYGDSDSWYGRYARRVERGDRKRIADSAKRRENMSVIRNAHFSVLSNDELQAIVDVLRASKIRRKRESS